MTQLIDLNMQQFDRDAHLEMAYDRHFFNSNRYKYHAHTRLHYSYRYRQPRPTDKLINFINNEYKKIVSDLIKCIIFENKEYQKHIRITNDQIQIILNDRINITV